MSDSTLETRLATLETTLRLGLQGINDQVGGLREDVQELRDRVSRHDVGLASLQGDLKLQASADVTGAQDHRDIWTVLDRHEAQLNQIKGAVAVLVVILGAITLRELFAWFRG